MQVETQMQGIARVNGVALNTADTVLSGDELRQRAYSELLRQAEGRGVVLAVLREAAAQPDEALV